MKSAHERPAIHDPRLTNHDHTKHMKFTNSLIPGNTIRLSSGSYTDIKEAMVVASLIILPFTQSVERLMKIMPSLHLQCFRIRPSLVSSKGMIIGCECKVQRSWEV